jgi:hypothetical protein
MKLVVQLCQPWSHEGKDDQSSEENPHPQRPVLAPADALEASLRRSVPAGDTGTETERTINVSCGHQPAGAATTYHSRRQRVVPQWLQNLTL